MNRALKWFQRYVRSLINQIKLRKKPPLWLVRKPPDFDGLQMMHRVNTPLMSIGGVRAMNAARLGFTQRRWFNWPKGHLHHDDRGSERRFLVRNFETSSKGESSASKSNRYRPY